MSTRAEKYIIALQAQYEGSKQIERLQQDISSTLGQLEKLQKFNADPKRLAANMEEGSSAADQLQAAMKQSFDPALATRLDKTKTRVADLSVEYNSLPHVRGSVPDSSRLAGINTSLPHVHGSVPLHISHLRRVFTVDMTPVFL